MKTDYTAMQLKTTTGDASSRLISKFKQKVCFKPQKLHCSQDHGCYSVLLRIFKDLPLVFYDGWKSLSERQFDLLRKFLKVLLSPPFIWKTGLH